MKRLALAAIAGLLVSGPAIACSVVPGHRVPSNLELAIAGETIVVAQVSGYRLSGHEGSGAVLARPIATLKGGPAPRQIELPGSWLAKPGMLVTTSAPRELRQPNPDALSGGCVRYIFKRGTKLVLFLRRENGKMIAYRRPFARDAEDVSGTNALWVKAVREYAAISLLPDAQREAAMRERVAALTAKGDADSLALAEDIGIELNRLRR